MMMIIFELEPVLLTSNLILRLKNSDDEKATWVWDRPPSVPLIC